jgi:hypothetical protein
MKLELLNKSQCYYDTLGDVTFYFQFNKQVESNLYHRLINYFHEEIRTDSFQAQIRAYFRSIRYEIGG